MRGHPRPQRAPAAPSPPASAQPFRGTAAAGPLPAPQPRVPRAPRAGLGIPRAPFSSVPPSPGVTSPPPASPPASRPPCGPRRRARRASGRHDGGAGVPRAAPSPGPPGPAPSVPPLQAASAPGPGLKKPRGVKKNPHSPPLGSGSLSEPPYEPLW